MSVNPGLSRVVSIVSSLTFIIGLHGCLAVPFRKVAKEEQKFALDKALVMNVGGGLVDHVMGPSWLTFVGGT